MIKDPLDILEDDGVPDQLRAMAAEMLRGRTDPRAIEALSKALAGPGPAVRLAAAWSLSESAANLARSASDAVLNDARLPNAGGLAMLGYLMQAGLPALRRALTDSGDVDERCQAAAIVLNVPYREAVQMLEEALDSDGRLGVFAASLLASSGNDDAVDRLLGTLADPNAPVDLRWIAADSLIFIVDDQIEPVLAQALSEPELVLAWSERSPTEAATLIDRAIASDWEMLRAAGQSAYRLTASRIEEPAINQIDEAITALTGHDHDAREAAGRQLVALAESEDVLAPLLEVVEHRFDDAASDLAGLADVLNELADPASVDALIKLARHRDWGTRRFAVEGLGRIGDPASEGTVCDVLLADPALYVRKAAAVAMSTVANSGGRALTALVTCVLSDPTVLSDSPDERVVRPAGKALGLLKLIAAVEPLFTGLGHDKAAVRKSAVWALGELHAARAFPEAQADVGLDELLAVLERDDDAAVRAAAAWALAQLRQPSALAVLTRCLGDGDEHLRDHVALALGELRDDSVVPDLVRALRQEAGRSDAVRARMVWALGKIQDPRAIDALHRVLIADRSSEVRMRCAQALGEIGDQRSGPVLARRLIVETDPPPREAMVYALGEIAWHDARADLDVRVVEDLSPNVRRASARVLGRIGNERSALILELLAASNEPPAVREAARRAVERIRRRLSGADDQ